MEWIEKWSFDSSSYNKLYRAVSIAMAIGGVIFVAGISFFVYVLSKYWQLL